MYRSYAVRCGATVCGIVSCPTKASCPRLRSCMLLNTAQVWPEPRCLEFVLLGEANDNTALVQLSSATSGV